MMYENAMINLLERIKGTNDEQTIMAMNVQMACVHDTVLSDSMHCNFGKKTQTNSFVIQVTNELKYKVTVERV